MPGLHSSIRAYNRLDGRAGRNETYAYSLRPEAGTAQAGTHFRLPLRRGGARRARTPTRPGSGSGSGWARVGLRAWCVGLARQSRAAMHSTRRGTRGRTRTDKSVNPADFESAASTNFATLARRGTSNTTPVSGARQLNESQGAPSPGAERRSRGRRQRIWRVFRGCLASFDCAFVRLHVRTNIGLSRPRLSKLGHGRSRRLTPRE